MLTTDASLEGWAGHIVIGPRLWHTFGFYFPKDGLTSSNQCETTAVLRSLLAFQPLLREHQIHALSVQSDNAVTVFNLRRQGAGPALLHMTREIFKLLQTLDIRLSVSHIPGVANVIADAFSRMEVTGDYALSADVYMNAIRTMEVRPTIDLFAHSKNNKCPRYAALRGSLAGQAEVWDAFSIRWSNEIPYIFPPVQLIQNVLQKIQVERVTALVVLPHWPSQPWWGLLRPMARMVLELGKTEHVLVPGPAMTASDTVKKLPPGLLLMVLVTPD
jgi:hypothetical protein